MYKWQPSDTQQGMSIIGLIFVIVLGAMAIKQFLDIRLLAQTARVTTGVVIDTNCSNHGHIDFTYSVNNMLYQGTGVSSACGYSNCVRTVVGEPVRVTYSSKKPDLAICAPLESKQRDVTDNIFVIGMLAAGLGWGIYRMKMHH